MKPGAILLFILSTFVLAAQPPPGGGPPGGMGDGIWQRNALLGEVATFDSCNGHQPGNGQYHHHIQPICLRAQLDDNLEVVATDRTGTRYRETTGTPIHSPILGWAFDGYPIYGPYGYSNPKDATSEVRRMRSSFRPREITDRHTLASWALAHHPNIPATLNANQYGPDVSPAFPVGWYVEDFDYAAGSGDLDQYNGRFTLTPDYPQGTYAYFLTIDDDGKPVFPYIIGVQYYGDVTGGMARAIPADAQDYFRNGSLAQAPADTPLLRTWSTKNATQFAQAVSGYNPAAGPKTTWPTDAPAGAQVMGGVTTPTLADVQRVRFNAGTVFVNSNNLASYVLGPWFETQMNGGVFMNWAAAQDIQVQVPRQPQTATQHRTTGLGAVGIWVNGVAVFNVMDGASWNNAGRRDAGGGIVAPSATHFSAASGERGPIAPGSLVTATANFNSVLATAPEASDNPQESLGGATVSVRDAAGVTRAARISFASSGQVNYRMPADTAPGFAVVTITAGGAQIPGRVNVVASYPNLIKLNDTNLGAAYIKRLSGADTAYDALFTTDDSGAAVAVPLEIRDGEETVLTLIGSGLGSGKKVTATIGGVTAEVRSFGPQGDSGMDQYDIVVPAALDARGKVLINISVDGTVSNSVYITVTSP